MGTMVLVAAVNRKGGAGKTTLLCLLALAWAERGRQVRLRDLDRQGSAQACVEHLQHPAIRLFTGADPADYILCDTPPGMRPSELANVVAWAELVLIPLQLGAPDLRATAETLSRLPEQRKARIIVNRLKGSTRTARDREKYLALLSTPALTCSLADRTAYGRALVEGYAALDRRARAELEALVDEIEEIAHGG